MRIFQPENPSVSRLDKGKMEMKFPRLTPHESAGWMVHQLEKKQERKDFRRAHPELAHDPVYRARYWEHPDDVDPRKLPSTVVDHSNSSADAFKFTCVLNNSTYEVEPLKAGNRLWLVYDVIFTPPKRSAAVKLDDGLVGGKRP